MEQTSEIKEPDAPVLPLAASGELEFKEVSFSIDNKEILKDISFHLEPGKTLGIMGMTGAGKSSIVNLIQRFYDPVQGDICLDRINIKQMPLKTLRQNFALVMQDVFLFSDSISENIKIGKRDQVNPQTVKTAAAHARADEFVSHLSDGYETIIGERGVGLSGGQKQRISIARAIAKETPILILDDSTSALDMETEYAIQQEVMKTKTLLRLYRYLLDYKKTIAAVLCIMAVCIAISLLNPLMIEQAIDVYIAGHDMPGLIRLACTAICLNLVFIAGVKIRMHLMADISNRSILTIREELYVHIQTLSFHFFDSLPTGKILARIISDINSLKDVMADSVTTLLPDLLTITGVLIIMFIKNWKLAMAAVLTLPLLIGGMYVVQTMGHRRWQIHRKKSSNLTAFIHESLSGIRIIQSFGAEDEVDEDMDELLTEYKDSFMDAVRIADGFGPLADLSWALGGFFLYFIGIRLMGIGNVEVGTFIAFSSYLGMFWQPIRNLANFYNKLITNISGAERVFDIMDTEPEIKDRSQVSVLPEVNGDVIFEHVSFAYSDEPDREILHDVSFHIAPGETIALVGPTGAGKTTIVNLVSRFYDIKSGRILVDGHDLLDVSIQSLRRQMGIMTQDNFLFSGTIMDNIRYGKPDASEEEVITAAKAVHAHEFIMKMEHGYKTELKERGAGLSIGQRQLLAFARTMVSQPRILVLDEATSSIDTHTELIVQQGIETLLKGRTSFVIAHRLSTIKKAVRIFVIDDGCIQEEGTHDELLKLGGAYYQLYQAQFRNLA